MLARGDRWSRVAALTGALMFPSLARAGVGVEQPADESPWADDAAPAASDASGDVLHADLASAAPQSDWIREGYGEGQGGQGDPRILNRKIRRAGRVTLAGAGIAILGGAIAISGAIVLYGLRPQSRLNELAKDNGGWLPLESDKRHRLISAARAGPIVAFTGIGVMVGGVITAAIARIRLKKLREQRRTSIVSIGPTMLGHGAEVHWEVKF